MRKTVQKKKKLPKKKRKKSLVRKTTSTKKKKTTRKRGRPRKSKDTTKNKKVSTINFVIEKKDEFLIDSSEDTPVINFQPGFLVNKTDVDEFLNEVEIDDEKSILIKNSSNTPQTESVLNNSSSKERKNELDKLIHDDYVFTEKTVKDATYNLKLKEDQVKISKTKSMPFKSKHVVNLRNRKPAVSNKENLELKFDMPRKKTVSNISSLYVRELLYLSSKTKFFKLTNFFGEGFVNFIRYIFKGIFLVLTALVNFLFSIFLSINNLGRKIIRFLTEDFDKVKNEEIKVFPRHQKSKFLFIFSPALLFNKNTFKNSTRIFSFVIICFLTISSIKALSMVSQVDAKKGEVLGISEMAFGDFQKGLESMANSDFQKAQINFSEANQRFLEAEAIVSQYNNLFLEILKLIPPEGKKLDNGIKLLSAGRLLSESAQEMSAVLKQQEKEIPITDKIKLISNNLIQTRGSMEKASDCISEIDLKDLPEGYQEDFKKIKENFPILINGLNKLDSFFEVVLDILGDKIPRRYLLVFQNNHELRPTGGFVGSMALVDVRNGELVNVEVPEGGPYDLQAGFHENIIAPRQFWSINPNLNFWDTNLFLHFPSSAELMLKYYEKSGGPTVDGLIAVNSSVMVEFLKIIGPIYLEDRGLEINSDNFMIEVQKIVEITDKGGKPKAIIGELFSGVLDIIFKDKSLDYLSALSIFNNSLTSKDIQMYFTNSALQGRADAYGWSGAMIDTSKDYLAIVNTNIGGSKTDEFVEQNIVHDVEFLSNGKIIDTVKIERTYIPKADNFFSEYQNRDYLAVYVPQGSKLLEATGFEEEPEDEYMSPVFGSKEDQDILEIQGRYFIDEVSGTRVHDEFNKTVFSGWQYLQPGEQKEIIIRYELPFTLNVNNEISLLDKFFKMGKNINTDAYTVSYDKQSGIISKLETNYTWSEDLNLIWSNLENVNQSHLFNKNIINGLILKK